MLAPDYRADVGEIRQRHVVCDEVGFHLAEHVFVAAFILIEIIHVTAIAENAARWNIFEENFTVSRHCLIAPVVIKRAGDGALGAAQLPDALLDAVSLLGEQSTQRRGIVAVKKAAYLPQRHSVDLHVLDEVELCRLGDVIIAVAP